jgi:hypothetical protein
VLSVLAPREKRERLENILIMNTSTLGVRSSRVDRTKAARSFETVTTRWGDVRIKLRAWNGRVIDAAPEYADCLALAERHELPIREIWNEAHRMGEAFVGRREGQKMERRA